MISSITILYQVIITVIKIASSEDGQVWPADQRFQKHVNGMSITARGALDLFGADTRCSTCTILFGKLLTQSSAVQRSACEAINDSNAEHGN